MPFPARPTSSPYWRSTKARSGACCGCRFRRVSPGACGVRISSLLFWISRCKARISLMKWDEGAAHWRLETDRELGLVSLLLISRDGCGRFLLKRFEMGNLGDFDKHSNEPVGYGILRTRIHCSNKSRAFLNNRCKHYSRTFEFQGTRRLRALAQLKLSLKIPDSIQMASWFTYMMICFQHQTRSHVPTKPRPTKRDTIAKH